MECRLLLSTWMAVNLVQHKVKDEFDLVCVVDCSDLLRTGNVIPEGRQPDINLDHHATNLNFARLNIVVPEAVATTELINDLLQSMEWDFSSFCFFSLAYWLDYGYNRFSNNKYHPKINAPGC